MRRVLLGIVEVYGWEDSSVPSDKLSGITFEHDGDHYVLISRSVSGAALDRALVKGLPASNLV